LSGLGSLEVVDPAGNYVPADLECAVGSAYGSGAAHQAGGGGGGSGFTGDPVQVVRDHVSGLEFDDRVERAGYLGSETPVIRIVRADAVVGKVTLSGDGSGGWLPSSIEGCSGTMLGWSREITGVTGSNPTGSGAFPACPVLDGALEPGPDADAEARAVAERYVVAQRTGDLEAFVAAVDPSTGDVLEMGDPASSATAFVVIDSGPATHDGLVVEGCGQDVSELTWAVSVDDGTDSASLDVTLYLIHREDGWKVWGSY
jgi:hypothetical protein